MTSEIDKFDPPCHVCAFGERKTQKLPEKELRADLDMKAKQNKKLRNRVVDSDDFVMFDHKIGGGEGASGNGGNKGKVMKLVSSSSLRSYSPKPFLARHFSFGSRSNSLKSSPKENHSAISVRKRSFFWSKSTKD
ncbi:unnamed protein product [Cochlearia groenlandica]